jgi:dTDP-4-dehydrorhamnose reductase
MVGWLITGAGGLLGGELSVLLRRRGQTAWSLDRTELDITRTASIEAALVRYRPSILVNCAAWTDVDAAEREEAAAFEVNAIGAGALAAHCSDADIPMIQLSTDYVFDGASQTPYCESDPPVPIGAYGRTKLAGERMVVSAHPAGGYIVRTGWLYGSRRPGFVSAMAKLARSGDSAEAVDDQSGQPTWSLDLAVLLYCLGQSALSGTVAPGIYHGTSQGAVTRFGLARAIFAALGADPFRVHPVPGTRFPYSRIRPANSALGHAAWARTEIEPIRDWHEALVEAIATL